MELSSINKVSLEFILHVIEYTYCNSKLDGRSHQNKFDIKRMKFAEAHNALQLYHWHFIMRVNALLLPAAQSPIP